MKEVNFGTHNLYLLIAGESGFIGTILMFIFLTIWVKSALDCQHPVLSRIIINYQLVFLLNGLSSHTIFTRRYHNIMIGVTFGILAGYSMMNHQKKKKTLAQSFRPGYTSPPWHLLEKQTSVTKLR